jgi:hypothetical protein
MVNLPSFPRTSAGVGLGLGEGVGEGLGVAIGVGDAVEVGRGLGAIVPNGDVDGALDAPHAAMNATGIKSRSWLAARKDARRIRWIPIAADRSTPPCTHP